MFFATALLVCCGDGAMLKLLTQLPVTHSRSGLAYSSTAARHAWHSLAAAPQKCDESMGAAAHPGPNHLAASRVSKVEVVEMADEGCRIIFGQLL